MSGGSGSVLHIIQCANTRRVMREALAAGWEWVGYTKAGHVEIRWPATGALLHCATTPSDENSWKQFARNITQVSGVTVWRKGNRRRSRKNPLAVDRQLEAARRKHAAQLEAERARRARAETRAGEERERRVMAALRAQGDDARRHGIEALMRPGYGR